MIILQLLITLFEYQLWKVSNSHSFIFRMFTRSSEDNLACIQAARWQNGPEKDLGTLIKTVNVFNKNSVHFQIIASEFIARAFDKLLSKSMQGACALCSKQNQVAQWTRSPLVIPQNTDDIDNSLVAHQLHYWAISLGFTEAGFLQTVSFLSGGEIGPSV